MLLWGAPARGTASAHCRTRKGGPYYSPAQLNTRLLALGSHTEGGPPGLAGVPGGGVDPAGRSVGLPSATPVPYTALNGGP